MSRRLGQGVVTGLDRSFISTVATYLRLPVMLMSSFFSDSAGHDDDSLDFDFSLPANRKVIRFDEAINVWFGKTTDRFNPAVCSSKETA